MNITQQVGAKVRMQVNQFYERVGYTGGIQDSDVVCLERQGHAVVGVVKLCKEEGVLVLRGLFVSEDLRGTGVGTRLLRAVSKTIGNQECWCIPYRYLSDFYSTVGFARCRESEAPAFLVERCGKYVSKGMDVVLMKRSIGFCDGGCPV